MALSGTIKGITIQLGADTTKLSQALSKAGQATRGLQTELKATERALKLDPGNATLLGNKMSILKEKTDAAKQKVDALKQAQAKLDAQGVDKNSEEYKKLQREIDLAEAEVRQLEQQMNSFGSVGAQRIAAVGEKMKAVGESIKSVGSWLTTHVTVPLAAAGAAGVAKFAEVDKTMQLTNATMGNTKAQADLLGAAMKDAAANSTFGMNDAAQATLNFARGGWDAEHAAAALAPAMNLAAGEGGNLDTVSAGLMATMNGFGADADEAGKYADVFANACNNSALDVDGLSNAMSVAAPIFSAAGYSVNDAALYMGTMANAGIDANVAANSLKTGMARLIEPSKQGAAWMDKLGISVTNADGTMKDSVQVQSELHDAFGGLSESEQVAAASAIFGKNQMSNWLALINTAPSDVQSLSTSLEKEGTTAEMASAMMGGFGGSIEKLKSSVDVAATSLGEALAPTISKVADAIQKAVDWFNGLDQSQQQTVATVGLVVAAIGPLLMIIGDVILKIGMLCTYAPAISGAFAGVAAFFSGTLIPAISGLIAAVVPAVAAFLPFIAIGAAVVAAGVLIYKNWDTIKQKATELFAVVSEKFAAIKDAIVTKLQTAKVLAEAVIIVLKSLFQSKMNEIKTAVSTALEAVRNFFQSKLEAARAVVDAVLNAIKAFFSTALNTVKTVVSTALEAVRNFFKTKLEAARTVVDSVLAAIKNFFNNALNTIKTTVSNALEAVRNAFQSKLNAAKGVVDSVLGTIKSAFTTGMNAAKSAVDTALNGMKAAFNVLNGIKSTVETAFNGVSQAVKTKMDEAQKTVSGAIEAVKKLFSGLSLKLDIKIPKISVSGGKAPFGIGGKGELPKFSVEWFDKGGIFNSPTIIGVGEKRPEFVGALDDLRAIVREESGGGVLMQEMVRLMTIMVEQGGRPITVNQEIYADSTSYAEQQKQAARSFKNIARALT